MATYDDLGTGAMFRNVLNNEADREFVEECWDPMLGNFGLTWKRFHEDRGKREWWVICPGGFIHFNMRMDGMKRIAEIAVHPDRRREGWGRRLVALLGSPVYLKTDADNEESNAFYAALGFELDGSDGRFNYWTKR